MQALWLLFLGVIQNIDWQAGAIKISKRILVAYLVGFFAFSGVAGLFLFNPFGGVKEAEAAWFNDNWGYRKALTIDESKVSGSTNLTDFPVLVSLSSDSSLSTNAQSDGDDIVFTAANGERLDHEIEYYSAGTLAAWVRIPSLSYNTNTTIYIYYGNPSVGSQSRSQSVWKSSYAAVYHLGEGAVTTVNDSTVNNNVASKLAAAEPAAYSSGKIGGAQDFDGSNDAITKTGIIQGATMTVSGWGRLESSLEASGADMISIGDYVTLRLDDPGVGRRTLGSYHQGGSSWVDTETNINYVDTGWHYFTYVANPSGSSQKVYVDGVERATDSSGAAIVFSTLGSNTVIGDHGNGGTTNSFNGQIDEVRISTTSRTVDWVLTEYNNQNDPSSFYSTGSEEKGTSPTLYWKFDAGQGTTVYDATTNGLNGTLGGSIGGGVTAGPTNIDNAGDPGLLGKPSRQVVRTSAGILYTAINDGGTIEVWKSSDGSTWTQQNSGSSPSTAVSPGANNNISVAIDAQDNIHIVWQRSGVNNYTEYVKFTTSTDTFGSSEQTINNGGGEFCSYSAIAVDSNNIPHVACTDSSAAFTVYSNRVGGTWKTPVTVVTSPTDPVDIAINEDNIPEIVIGATGVGLKASVGNQNNATSFTTQTVDATISVQGASIAVDASGNTWIGYVDENGATDYATLVKHNDNDAWSTWQTPVNNTNDGTEVSIATVNDNVYMFYQDVSDNDIKYNRYTGSWTGEVTLQTGTFQDVHAKWSYLNNNQGTEQIDYLYSDGTDVFWATLGFGTASSTPDWKTDDFCIAGKCLFFDGTNADAVVKSDNAKLDFSATESFSIGAWIKRNGTVSANSYIVAKTDTTTGGYKVYMDDSGDLCFGIDDDSSFGPDVGSCTNGVDFDDDRWHYVVGVRDVTADKTYLYIDGVERDNDTDPTTTTLANSGAFITGIDSDGSSGKWKGYIDEVKVYRSALSAAQIKANFVAKSNPEGVSGVLGTNTQNMPGALSDGLTGYWKMDESSWTIDCATTSVADSSGNGNNATSCPNSTGPTLSVGKFGNSGLFDTASADGIEIPSATSVNFAASGQYSAGMWINPSSISASANGTSLLRKSNTGNGYRLYITQSSNLGILLPGSSDCPSTNNCYSTTTISTSTWTHVMFTYANGVVKLYINGALAPILVNGIQMNSVTLSGVTDNTATTTYISEGTTDCSGFQSCGITGKIDETRIYNRALSGAEVAQLYNWAPGPKGYWKMDEGSWTNDCSTTSMIDSSGTGQNGKSCPNGSGVSTLSTGRFGNAPTFNGTSQFTKVNTPTLPTSDITISFWMYPTSVSGTQYLVYAQDGSFNDEIAIFLNGTTLSGEVGLASVLTHSATIAVNNWYYVTFTRSGSTQSFYLNGVFYPTTVSGSNALTFGSCPLIIGASNTSSSCDSAFGNYFKGKIDDLKIYNYARNGAQILEDMNVSHPAPGSPVGSAVAYWKFDEGYSTTANDSNSLTGGAENLTLSASTAWTTAGKFNKAYNGADNVRGATGSDDDDLDFAAAEDLTISGWFKSDSANNPAANEYLVEKGAAVGTAAIGYAVYTSSSSDGFLCFGIDDDAVTNFPEDSACSTKDFYDNTWHYWTATKTGTSKIELFVDGRLVGSDTSLSSTGTLANASVFRIGDANATNGSDEFLGDLDEIKVFRSALTQDQINLDLNRGSAEVMGTLSSTQSNPNSADAEYCIPGDTSTCTAPVGRWDFEEGTGTTAQDSSGTGNTGTMTNTPTFTIGKVGKALNLVSASSQYVAINGAATSAQTGSASVSFWFSPAATYTGSGDQYLFSIADASSTNDFKVSLVNAQGTLKLRVGAVDATTGRSSWTGGTWYHIVAVFNSASGGSMQVYVNGVLEASATTVTRSAVTPSTAADIGRLFSGSYFNGKIDAVRVYNYARSAAQAAWDYNKGGPVGSWKFDECQGTTINDSSGNGYSGTQSGATAGTCNTSSTFWGGSAGDSTTNSGSRNYTGTFNGSSDKVVTSAINPIDGLDCDGGVVGTQSCTTTKVSWGGWFYPTTSVASKTLIEKATNSTTAGEFHLTTDASSKPVCGIFYSSAFHDASAGSRALTLNSWNHVMCVYNGATIKTYLNGNEVGSSSETTAITAASSILHIGENSGSSTFYTGRIDDVKVYSYNLTAAQVKNILNDGATRYGPTSGAP